VGPPEKKDDDDDETLREGKKGREREGKNIKENGE